MRKHYLLLCILLCAKALFAQVADNVFYKAPTAADSANTDSIPAFTRSCFGFYFMPGYSFNSGAVIAPPEDINQIGLPGATSISYSANNEKPAFGFSFGLFFESKPFLKRLFYSVGLELADYRYTGNATMVTKNPNTAYNSTQDISYSWTTFSAGIPIAIHFAIIQSKKCRLDIVAGGSGSYFISQSNSGDQSQPKYDDFNPVTIWGTAGLGFEYFVGHTFLLRFEPCYNYCFMQSPQKRRLSAEGIKIGVIVK